MLNADDSLKKELGDRIEKLSSQVCSQDKSLTEKVSKQITESQKSLQDKISAQEKGTKDLLDKIGGEISEPPIL